MDFYLLSISAQSRVTKVEVYADKVEIGSRGELEKSGS